MGVKYMAAFAVSGILTVATGSAWAGSDGGDKAIKQPLKFFRTEMITPEQLRKSQLKSELASQPVEPPAPNSKTGMSDSFGPYLHVDNGFGIADTLDGSQTVGSTAAKTISKFRAFSDAAVYHLGHNLRTDVTFSIRPEADVESTNAAGNKNEPQVDALTVMFNGYVNFANLSMITPYIGAGLGYARLSIGTQTTLGGNTSATSAVANNLAYAVMGGAAIAINNWATLDFDYRLINMGKIDQSRQFSDGTISQAPSSDDLMVHEIKAGLRFQF